MVQLDAALVLGAGKLLELLPAIRVFASIPVDFSKDSAKRIASLEGFSFDSLCISFRF